MVRCNYGNFLIAGSADGDIVVWDTWSFAEIRVLEGHSAPVTGIVPLSDTAQILSFSQDGMARLWSLETGELLRVLAGHSGPIYAGVLIDGDNRVLTMSRDGSARLWDVSVADLVAYACSCVYRNLTLQEISIFQIQGAERALLMCEETCYSGHQLEDLDMSTVN